MTITRSSAALAEASPTESRALSVDFTTEKNYHGLAAHLHGKESNHHGVALVLGLLLISHVVVALLMPSKLLTLWETVGRKSTLFTTCAFQVLRKLGGIQGESQINPTRSNHDEEV